MMGKCRMKDTIHHRSSMDVRNRLSPVLVSHAAVGSLHFGSQSLPIFYTFTAYVPM
ncbi:hypothetical protein FBY13_11479 [Pantoea sp. SJZ147]|nr:hypothetical protein FBY13_11479 [Pantoea sp. SJZ147]